MHYWKTKPYQEKCAKIIMYNDTAATKILQFTLDIEMTQFTTLSVTSQPLFTNYLENVKETFDKHLQRCLFWYFQGTSSGYYKSWRGLWKTTKQRQPNNVNPFISLLETQTSPSSFKGTICSNFHLSKALSSQSSQSIQQVRSSKGQARLWVRQVRFLLPYLVLSFYILSIY